MQPITFRAPHHKRQLFVMLGTGIITIGMPIIAKFILDMKDFPVFFVIMGVLYFYAAISDYYRELIIDDHGVTVKRLFNATKSAKWNELATIQHFIFFNRPIEYLLFERDVDLLDSLYPSVVPKPYNRRVLLLNEWANHEQIKVLAEQHMQPAAHNDLIVPFTFNFWGFFKQVLVYGAILIPIIVIFS